MGNGFTRKEARTVLGSLNDLFDGNMPSTRAKYTHLKYVYPEFLQYISDTSDRHVWRKRTLRFAAMLLASEIDFTVTAHPYPGKNFKRWLRWLTWLQVMAPADAKVKIDGVLQTTISPAQAIMDTLKLALDDPNGKVKLDWNEQAGTMKVDVERAAAPTYKISVFSKKEHDIPSGHHDNDEDDLP
jgi:hypothetical protein